MKSNEFVNICFFCAHHDRCVSRKNLGDVRVPRDFKDPTLYCGIFMKYEDTSKKKSYEKLNPEWAQKYMRQGE